MPPKTNKVTTEVAEHNAASLLKLWKLGRQSLERCPPEGLQYGKTAGELDRELRRLQAEATEIELAMRFNHDTLGKARRIATDYTQDQIREIGVLIRQHRSRFSTSHILRVLSVPNRKARDKMLSQAVRESWTTSTLERRVQVARQSRRVGSGRNPFVPPDDGQRLVMLEGLTLKWLRWTRRANAELPKDIQNLLLKADDAVQAVQTAIGKHLPRK